MPVTSSTIARPGNIPVHQMFEDASETARWMSYPHSAASVGWMP